MAYSKVRRYKFDLLSVANSKRAQSASDHQRAFYRDRLIAKSLLYEAINLTQEQITFLLDKENESY